MGLILLAKFYFVDPMRRMRILEEVSAKSCRSMVTAANGVESQLY
jgi:hypothetical protein